ncbi:MAG: hypothetical protein ACI33M_07245 [Lysinibacillus sp.]
MDPIRKAMEEVYQEGTFSNERKKETIKLTQKKKRDWWIPTVATAFTLLFVICLLFIIQPVDEQISMSTEQAPKQLETVYMERFNQAFHVSTEDERTNYLSESDWLIQRAIESGNSTFYNTPTLTAVERENLASILHYLYLWRLEYGIKEIPIEPLSSFEEIRKSADVYVNVLGDYFENRPYISAEEEKRNILLSSFGSMTQESKIGIIILIIAFIGLFILNVRNKRNILFKAIPIILIALCVVPMIMPTTEKYGYDETSIMKAVMEDEQLAGATLTYAATFGNNRYALIRTAEGINYLASFNKEDYGYVLRGTIWGKHTVMMEPDIEWNRYVIGLHEGHEIARIDLIGEEASKGEVIPVNVEVGEAIIRAVVMPNEFKSFSLEYFNENGERMH